MKSHREWLKEIVNKWVVASKETNARKGSRMVHPWRCWDETSFNLWYEWQQIIIFNDATSIHSKWDLTSLSDAKRCRPKNKMKDDQESVAAQKDLRSYEDEEYCITIYFGRSYG